MASKQEGRMALETMQKARLDTAERDAHGKISKQTIQLDTVKREPKDREVPLPDMIRATAGFARRIFLRASNGLAADTVYYLGRKGMPIHHK
jgi:hypothetical protein